jgi:hypothetical protein
MRVRRTGRRIMIVTALVAIGLLLAALEIGVAGVALFAAGYTSNWLTHWLLAL